jgi:DHA2 family methylenomycin A resistance protein-like MFS transporter
MPSIPLPSTASRPPGARGASPVHGSGGSPARGGSSGQGRSRGGERVALAAASLGFAVVQLDVSVVNVAARSIGTDLGGTISDLQWVVDAYTVAFAALILTGGVLGDRWGAPRLLMFGFGLFTLASVACGLAPSIGTLIAFRAVQGTGAAVLGSCSLALLSRTFPDPERRTRALGTWALSGSVAMAAGPLAGGVLIAIAGWRAIFFINLPVGVAGYWLTTRCTDAASPRRGGSRTLDLPGQATAAVALAALAGATIETGTYGLSLPVLAGYAIAVVAGTGFVVIERRAARPMLPLPLFRSGTFSAAVAVGCLLNLAAYGLIFVVSLYLQRAEGLSPLATGAALLPFMAALMAGNAVSARVARARGRRTAIGGGSLIIAAACAVMWLTVTIGPHPPARQLVPVIILMALFAGAAFGIGILMPAMTAAVLGETEPSRAGVASGTLTASRQTGSVIGVAVFGTLLAGGLTAGFRASLLAAVALALVMGALSRLIRR